MHAGEREADAIRPAAHEDGLTPLLARACAINQPDQQADHQNENGPEIEGRKRKNCQNPADEREHESF